jgi:hypothetical protein
MKLTPHFTAEELTTTNNKEYKEKNKELIVNGIDYLYHLAGFAERVRAIVGCPMIITSGYRCHELNEALKGSRTSQHVLCEAIDFIPTKRSTKDSFLALMFSDLKYHQLILEYSGNSNWIHIGIGGKKENLVYKDKKYHLVHSVRELDNLLK